MAWTIRGVVRLSRGLTAVWNASSPLMRKKTVSLMPGSLVRQLRIAAVDLHVENGVGKDFEQFDAELSDVCTAYVEVAGAGADADLGQGEDRATDGNFADDLEVDDKDHAGTLFQLVAGGGRSLDDQAVVASLWIGGDKERGRDKRSGSDGDIADDIGVVGDFELGLARARHLFDGDGDVDRLTDLGIADFARSDRDFKAFVGTSKGRLEQYRAEY